MKSTGIVRKIDDLGRVVMPKELRRNLDINEGDSLEIFIENADVIFRKYEPGCIFCGDSLNIVNFKGKTICNKCLKEMKGTK